MLKQITRLLIFITVPLLISTPSLAFTPETDCPAIVTVSTQTDLTAALADSKFTSDSPYLKDDKYVVCFQTLDVTPVTMNTILDIGSKGKPLHIYGLNLKPGKIGFKEYTGLLILVSGANITFHNLDITGATQALSLTGSNISILDSTINASQTGISIVGTAVQPSENIKISGTTIAGQGVTDSKGVYVENGKSVSLANNDTINNMGYGVYVKSGEGVNVTETTFKIADVSKAIFWEGDEKPVVDTSKIGKSLDEKGEKIIKIKGLAPTQECSSTTNGFVTLFTRKLKENVTQYYTFCPINPLKSGEKICIPLDAGATECSEPTDCLCFTEGQCIFDCNVNLNTDTQTYVVFDFTDILGNTYPLSEFASTLMNLPPSTGAFPATIPAPIEAGLTDSADQGSAISDLPDDTGKTDASDAAGDSSEESDDSDHVESPVVGQGVDQSGEESGGGGVAAPLDGSIGLQNVVGCNLTASNSKNQRPYTLTWLLIGLLSFLPLIVVRCSPASLRQINS